MKKGAKLLLTAAAAVLVCLLGLLAWNLRPAKSQPAAVTAEPAETPAETPTETAAPEPVPDWLDIDTAEGKYRLFRQDHDINNEVKAYLYFTSGLVEQRVVQS